MVVNKKVSGRARSVPVGLSVGTLLSLVITLSCTALASYLVLSGKFSEEAIGYCAIVTLLISSAFGALVSACMIKRRWMLVCLGAGGIYYLLLLAITALFFGGQYQGMGVTALAVLGGSGGVGLLGLNRETGIGRKKKKHSFR